MKKGDIYYYHERVWSEEEMKIHQPHPDEIFRHKYIKLIEHNQRPKGSDTCDGDSWSCFGIAYLENETGYIPMLSAFKRSAAFFSTVLFEGTDKEKTVKTNTTLCTKFISKKFKRVYEV
jgi:hypothetical protein